MADFDAAVFECKKVKNMLASLPPETDASEAKSLFEQAKSALNDGDFDSSVDLCTKAMLSIGQATRGQTQKAVPAEPVKAQPIPPRPQPATQTAPPRPQAAAQTQPAAQTAPPKPQPTPQPAAQQRKPPPPPPAQKAATQIEAAKVLNEMFAEIKNSPKYLNVAPLVKEYNAARGKYYQNDFDSVVATFTNIKETLAKMKEDYNNVSLKVIKAKESLGADAQKGLNMDYATLQGLIEQCTEALSRGDISAASQSANQFEATYTRQKEGFLEPMKMQVRSQLDEAGNLIQGAEWDNVDVSGARDRYGQIAESLRKAQRAEDINAILAQIKDIKDLVEMARNQKLIKDEKPRMLSIKIQAAKTEIIQLRNYNVNIDSLQDVFDNINNMFMNAEEDEEFDRLGAQLEKFNKMIAEKKSNLSGILKSREEVNADFEGRRHVLKDLTSGGYLMAAQTNKLEKAQTELNNLASVDTIKVAKRFVSNFDAEIESIKSTPMDEFNLKIKLLQDYEKLSTLYDKLEQEEKENDDVMEFLVNFSQYFSEVTDLDGFKGVESRMKTNMDMLCSALGISAQESEAQAQDRQARASLEQVRPVPPPPPD